MKPPELFSHSPVLAAPGRLPLFIAAIAAWILVAASLLVATAHSPALAVAVGLLALPAIVAGPLVGGTVMRVTVGADGIATRYLGRERFVRLLDVTAIRVVDSSIEVCVARGPSLWLRPVRVAPARRGRRGQILVAEPPEGSAMLQALRAAHAGAGAEPRVADDDEAVWARRDRTVARWVADVFGQSGDTADYRAGALDREGLLRVAERPLADPTARAAAAAVLHRQRLEPGERERLRVAAGATANPRLRVALEAVTDGDCDAATLERQLERVAKG